MEVAPNGNGDKSKSNRQHEHQHQHERTLRNTFGWTRIDIITMLIVCIFMAALCFSLLVEALQTLIHIDHQDAMHHPAAVITIGGVGLILNGICYLLIGGYTFHQGSFLHITPTGDVVLDRVVSSSALKDGKRRLSKSRREGKTTETKVNAELEQQQQREIQRLLLENRRQSFMEMFRDICSECWTGERRGGLDD